MNLQSFKNKNFKATVTKPSLSETEVFPWNISKENAGCHVHQATKSVRICGLGHMPLPEQGRYKDAEERREKNERIKNSSIHTNVYRHIVIIYKNSL